MSLRVVGLFGVFLIVQQQVLAQFNDDLFDSTVNLAENEIGDVHEEDEYPPTPVGRSGVRDSQCGVQAANYEPGAALFDVGPVTDLDYTFSRPMTTKTKTRFLAGPYGDVPSEDGMRVIGGVESVKHSWPWQVRVRPCYKRRCVFLCGGTIIGDRWVATAAHCIPYRANKGNITAGNHILKTKPSEEPYAKNYTISRIIVHPGWNKYIRWNDIALIKVVKDFGWSDHVKPVCLPSSQVCINPGTACAVVGWGYTSEKGGISHELQEVAVRVISHEVCQSSLYYDTKVYSTNICAGFAEGGIDSCAGDSGGPLLCRASKDGPFLLYGIVSWGYGCARAHKPGVYTRVASFADWIDSKMSSDSTDYTPPRQTPDSSPCLTCVNHGVGECDDSTDRTGGVVPVVPTKKPAPTTRPPPTTVATTTKKPATSDSCGGLFDSGVGSFHTPNFPAKYRPEDTCVWRVGSASKSAGLVSKILVRKPKLAKSGACLKKGDYIEVRCSSIRKRTIYCSGSNMDVLTCPGLFTVTFKANKDRMVSIGAEIFYKVEGNIKLNACNVKQDLYHDDNDPMSDSQITVWPCPKLKTCEFRMEVAADQKVLFKINHKTVLSAREKRRGNSYVAVQCKDVCRLYEEDGKTQIKKFCGKRSYKSNPNAMSETNVMIMRCSFDKKASSKERIVASFTGGW